MPVKPVTHNKYSDMKRYTWIWIMLIALLSGCEDDFDKGGSNPGEGVTEGMITFRFSTEEAPVIVTRVGETGQQESLENVLVMVFDKDGKLVNKAYQQLTIDNHSVNIYLTAVEDQSIYALCNLPEGDETEDLINNSPVTLTGLKAKYTTIRTPEGAYGGKHIMTGSLPLELTTTGQCSLLRFDARLSACGIAHQSSGFYKLSDCCCIGRCIGTDIAFLIVVIQSCTIILVEIALKEIYNIKVLAIVKYF